MTREKERRKRQTERYLLPNTKISSSNPSYVSGKDWRITKEIEKRKAGEREREKERRRREKGQKDISHLIPKTSSSNPS